MRTRLFTASLLVILSVSASRAETPLGTVFTYHGRLTHAGSPASGLHDLRFRLYDADVGPTQIGATLCADNVSVTAGLFTVPLDFGAQFAGQERFLEIEVRADTGLDCANPAGFVILDPRQALTATPYSLYSRAPWQTSGVDLSYATGKVGIGTTIPTHLLTLQSADINAQRLIGPTPPYGYGARLNFGDANYAFIEEDVDDKLNFNANRFAFSSGDVGIGTTSPTSKLDVRATGATGVYSETSGTGTAVFGLCVTDSSGTGVYGRSTAVVGGYGVRGENSSAFGWAVYASGRLGGSGTKAFRIDHPDDPENKYLLHYSAESPEVINFYRGTVVLDGAGEAVVELPHYFAKINKTPSYQLTAVGAPMPMLHVAGEISESALIAGAKAEPGEAAPACSFRIAGGAPGAKVSWEVKALRNDRWVQKRGAPVEVEKQGLEKGTYQHPELYGQPPEKGMNYDAERQRPSPTALPAAKPD